MDIQKVSEDAQCRIFSATLSDATQEWYFKFPLTNITSWEMFIKEFYKKIYASCIHSIEANQLVDIRQKEGEPLKEYIKRFVKAVAHAKTVGNEGNMMAIIAGVHLQSP
ncbi:uncharacterized protein LOC133805745 [Humulus lupulus]|uniref:uncharacterized protein LOC133805745 n=1 Tax=Humulus lupulus TaxID=3486 RepID=UPI002B404B62|nr:uncharacterized protein LOC133805745 [Humulus lupulus]